MAKDIFITGINCREFLLFNQTACKESVTYRNRSRKTSYGLWGEDGGLVTDVSPHVAVLKIDSLKKRDQSVSLW
mgnify:CR=1 FL=1